jgi:REP element-mobilizing transposase RayT
MELNNRIDRYVDLGHGSCFLAKQRVGELVENAFLHFDDERYDLLAWCVMSNHVHVLAVPRPGSPLSDIVQSWKSFTAKEANKELRRKGQFWAPDYFDEFMKSTSQLEATIEYIERNPVNAKLVFQPAQWRFSSAALRHEERVNRGRAKFPEIDPEQLP